MSPAIEHGHTHGVHALRQFLVVHRVTRSLVLASSSPSRSVSSRSFDGRRLPEYFASNYYALYLIGPLIDLGELRVPNVPLQGEVLPVAGPTVHLQSVDRGLHRNVGGTHLRHSGLPGMRAPRIAEPGRPMCQEPRRLYCPWPCPPASTGC